ncbi:MAG: OmpA family protein [Bacteroidales bacterium]|nr:OmpA family protein [Bacteroidales bacterium]
MKILAKIILIIIFFHSINVGAQNAEKAFAHYKNHEFKQATEIFKKLIEKKKELIPSKYGLALVYSDENNLKPKYKSAYRAVNYIEKKYPKFSEKQKDEYNVKYGLNENSLAALKTKIVAGALNEAYQSGSPDKLNDFKNFYKDSIAIAKAQKYQYELIFKDCKKRNIIEVYQDFKRKFPDAPQADSAQALADNLMQKKFDKLVQEGDYQLLMQFKTDYPEFKNIDSLDKEIKNIYLARGLYLDKPFDEKYMADYVRFIKMAAPSELAFIALQRILTQSLKEKNWQESIHILNRFKPYFPNDLRIDKMIAILKAPEENIKRQSISSVINTDKHEYAPVVTADGKSLYFCGRGREGNIGGEDIFVTHWKNGEWTKPELIQGHINTDYAHEAPLAVSADGNRLLLFSHADIYFSDKGEYGWSQARIFPSVNTPDSWEADAMISADGNALFFISDREGNIGSHHEFGAYFHGAHTGNSDIYVSVRKGKGWSRPVNLGKTINTPFAERSPFLHPDMKTLYFSSDGHAGLGMLDVFKSTRLSDTSWTEWSEPVNLGKEINSYGDDYDYKISTDGKTALMSVLEDDNFDIYQVELTLSMRPNAVALIFGTVKNSTGKPVKAKVRWENLETGELIGFSQSDIKDGSYIIVLPLGKNYGYFIDHKNYYPISGNIDLRNQEDKIEIEKNFVLYSYTEIVQNQVAIPLQNVFFDFNKYTLKPESYPELNRLVKFIQKNEDLKIEISGHTDNKGTETYNKELSQKRADAVKTYLVNKGCNAVNLTAKGYGESKPLAENSSDENRAKNRRVEFKVLK